ncbi:SAGA histone acetylase and TREX-2 complexes component [Malassezia psittaci]|uniref:Transcription and mRNA export factor SUS1 n=1 Tax=Malassezia psittaci TaxID=1821823 RepID=A0AAF0F7Y3_9BASI|nr:SAGA histone acetylase and TREX-2 complexes component [Malassezia psittaci]
MSDGSDSGEQLLNLLHQRLVATGEWNTLLAELRTLLGESEWQTQLRDEAEREAHAQEPLRLPALVAKLGPYAQKTLPDSVREAMTVKLRDFLDRNLEDA